MLTPEQIVSYQQRFGLSYHVSYALDGERMVGLRGKTVLEVGGSLPEGFVREALGVRSWIAIEEMAYWHEMQASGGAHGTPPREATRPLAEARSADIDAGYAVFSGRVENLPPALLSRFDVVFSIAAFEHIDRLPLALDAMHTALRADGRVFSLFAPVWSAANGHHLPRIRDAAGNVFDHNASPIPYWGHLLFRPPDMFQHLLKHTDRATAAEMVYYVYQSPHINRLFSEDYAAYCQASKLAVDSCEGVFHSAPPPETQLLLESVFPGRRSFDNNGLRIVLRKA